MEDWKLLHTILKDRSISLDTTTKKQPQQQQQ